MANLELTLYYNPQKYNTPGSGVTTEKDYYYFKSKDPHESKNPWRVAI